VLFQLDVLSYKIYARLDGLEAKFDKLFFLNERESAKYNQQLNVLSNIEQPTLSVPLNIINRAVRSAYVDPGNLDLLQDIEGQQFKIEDYVRIVAVGQNPSNNAGYEGKIINMYPEKSKNTGKIWLLGEHDYKPLEDQFKMVAPSNIRRLTPEYVAARAPNTFEE
jgi:hypothetical protein